MRLVIYTGIFLFIFGSAWVLYLDTQNKKFIENLPQLPVAPQTKKVAQTEEDADLIEQEDSQNIHATERLGDLMPDPPHVHPHRPVYNHSPDNDSNDLTDITQAVDEQLKLVLSADEKRSEDLGHFLPTDPGFDLEKIRQGLIHEFGDIPEVDIVLQHMPAEIEEGQVVTVQRSTTHANVLEYHKAIATLWPTPENLRAVERTKELMEWRGGPLPSWVNPDHVTYTDE